MVQSTFSHWSGQWIGSDRITMNQLRTAIFLRSAVVRSTTALISDIGYYQLCVEGELIDRTRRLDIGWKTHQPWFIGPGARPDLVTEYDAPRALL